MFHTVLNTLLNGITNFVTRTAQKIKFSIKDYFSKCDQIRSFLTFQLTEEILNGKLHFLCSGEKMNGIAWLLTISESIGCLINA